MDYSFFCHPCGYFEPCPTLVLVLFSDKNRICIWEKKDPEHLRAAPMGRATKKGAMSGTFFKSFAKKSFLPVLHFNGCYNGPAISVLQKNDTTIGVTLHNMFLRQFNRHLLAAPMTNRGQFANHIMID